MNAACGVRPRVKGLPVNFGLDVVMSTTLPYCFVTWCILINAKVTSKVILAKNLKLIQLVSCDIKRLD